MRALNRSLQLAQNSTTLAKLGERARHLKKGFPGALKMLGAGIVAVSTFVTAATLWIAGALTWIALVILVLFRPIWAIFRVLRGLAFARRPA